MADLETTIMPTEFCNETLQQRSALLLPLVTADITITRPIEQIGDLDEWTLIPGEKVELN